jgi:hypothetical protein
MKTAIWILIVITVALATIFFHGAGSNIYQDYEKPLIWFLNNDTAKTFILFVHMCMEVSSKSVFFILLVFLGWKVLKKK